MGFIFEIVVKFQGHVRIIKGAGPAVHDIYLHSGIRRDRVDLLGNQMERRVAVEKHQRGMGPGGGAEPGTGVILTFVVVSAGRAPVQGSFVTNPLHFNSDSALGLDISEIPDTILVRFKHGDGCPRGILKVVKADGADVCVMALCVEGHFCVVNRSGAADVNGVFVAFAFVNEIGTARGDGHGCACHRKFALHVVLQCGAASAAKAGGNEQ